MTAGLPVGISATARPGATGRAMRPGLHVTLPAFTLLAGTRVSPIAILSNTEAPSALPGIAVTTSLWHGSFIGRNEA